ncbi:MAG: hypothetical protein RLZ39_624, partial [Bacteroidota bacterium]
ILLEGNRKFVQLNRDKYYSLTVVKEIVCKKISTNLRI